MTLEGGCFCGAVRYRAVGAPFHLTHCHCADCRRTSGSPFVSWVSFRVGDFKITAGKPESLRYPGRVRTFCGKCGSPLTFQAGEHPEEIDVTICSMDFPERLTPQDHTWVSDRLPWIKLADNLPTFDTQRLAGPQSRRSD